MADAGKEVSSASPNSKKLKAGSAHKVLRYYRTPGVLPSTAGELLKKARAACSEAGITSIATERCFNIEVDKESSLNETQKATLEWLLRETFEPGQTSVSSFLSAQSSRPPPPPSTIDSEAGGLASLLVEVGPRLSFESAVSSNAKSICRASGVDGVTRFEVSRRFLVNSARELTAEERSLFLTLVHDRMTEMEYPEPVETFHSGEEPQPFVVVPVLAEGRDALIKINNTRGLGFDDWDLDYYLALFRDTLERDPTDVELFDMGQANSEHSRHWFFSGKMVIDGNEKEKTLFKLVKETLPKTATNNSVIAFHDNSSAIKGPRCAVALPASPGKPCTLKSGERTLHPILTAETHNFPSGVAPFPGAETGTGGRLRDVMATGRGAKPIAGISSYCVGNLRIPGYPLPWEDASWEYASNLASPLDIEIQASNGASDYGNKFGEPVVHGFTRSFGQRLPGGERYEYVKPIMFSAGIGQMDASHAVKGTPEKGMWVVKVGGPAYRIGLGGGAASSRVGDAKTAELDFNAVQRGDAEMENRLNRLMRACVELGEDNPIVSIHDQGAGGNGNVLKEIVDPAGATYDIRKLNVGDETMSILEIWGAEYQENNALLIRSESADAFLAMSARENCPASLLGKVSGNGRVTVVDSRDGSVPYDLPLKEVLGGLPQKTFVDDTKAIETKPLQLPENVGSSKDPGLKRLATEALDRVLRLLHVGSKRFLTNKVDRCVTGLVAQQQCVGPLQTPLANCGVVASSHFTTTGIATSCGEQPMKGLLDPAAMARLTVAESLTNIMWAKLTALEDIKASGNWMWPAKLDGECAKMWNACVALRQALLDCGVGIDGGKDSLSMAARCGDELVKSPGTLVMTLYCTCADITKTVTPDLKLPGEGRLLYVDLGAGKACVGGTCLAQVYSQIGEIPPDVEDFKPLVAAFKVTQELLNNGLISAGHDRSDGGLVTTLLEMAFAGEIGCGLDVNIPLPTAAAKSGSSSSALDALFSEEVGFVMEVSEERCGEVVAAYRSVGVEAVDIGKVTSDGQITVRVGGEEGITGTTSQLRGVWEATSCQLERLQCDTACAAQEEASLTSRTTAPAYKLTFTPKVTPAEWKSEEKPRPKVCVLRQEGSNGDREMLSAFHEAGLEAWDVNMNDLLQGTVTLDRFQGVVFVGGFSYADVLDSAKGWAATIKFNNKVWEQFLAFKARSDTFSLGVCNGCQLMALLGWIPKMDGMPEEQQPRFIHNQSGRFESRWSNVQIMESPAILLAGMAGSTLGVWVAHGEGRVHFPQPASRKEAVEGGLAPVRFVDDTNVPTEAYPFNPNGSPEGIAGLCSEDGRHLAVMPHPERCFLTWQWPYMPKDWRGTLAASPWLKMFQNAREWCDAHPRPDVPSP